jgi:acetyl-CoA synthetase (ADP-forming)
MLPPMARLLSEYESKQLLAGAGVPIPDEKLVTNADEAVAAAEHLGYPVALKLCGRGIAHKTERDLVRLDLMLADDVRRHAEDLLGRREPDEADAGVLVSPMVSGRRELIAGLIRDPQYGPCVMFGLGGIFAELLGDVAFAVAPLQEHDAAELIDALDHSKILGEFRGEPAVDRDALARILESLARIGCERDDVASIDVNPLIVRGAEPIVIDALVELVDR